MKRLTDRDKIAVVKVATQRRGNMTLARAQADLKEQGVIVSQSTINRIWRAHNVPRRTAPRFDERFTKLLVVLAETHPWQLGLEEDHWTLGSFRRYLVSLGLENGRTPRKTLARVLDRAGLDRRGPLWPEESFRGDE